MDFCQLRVSIQYNISYVLYLSVSCDRLRLHFVLQVVSPTVVMRDMESIVSRVSSQNPCTTMLKQMLKHCVRESKPFDAGSIEPDHIYL